MSFSLGRVFLAPTARQPLKTGAEAGYQDRLAMVSLLCELQQSEPYFQPSAVDGPLPGKALNYTVDTLTRFRNTIASSDGIFAIIGVDAFMGLPRWRSPDTLLRLAEWIVVSRPGLSLGNLWAADIAPEQMGRVHLLEGVHESVSATEVRRLLRIGSDCDGLLSPSIVRFIYEHQLYGT